MQCLQPLAGMCNITHILAQVEQWQDAEKGAIELLEAENSGGGGDLSR